MKRCRRIEITAFRRRVTIVSGNLPADNADAEVWLNHTDSSETIETESAEGQHILIEAVRLLEENFPTGLVERFLNKAIRQKK